MLGGMPSSSPSPKRKPSGLHIALADRIALLDSAQWQAASRGASWFFSRDYLSMLEGVLPAAIEPRYALIGSAGAPIAAVVLQWARLEGRNLRPRAAGNGAAGGDDDDDDDENASPLRRLFGAVARRGADALAGQVRERVLVCGNLLTYGQHAVALAPGAEATLAWSGVAEAIYRLRRAEKLAGQAGFVVVKDLPASAGGSDGVALLSRVGYRQADTEPNMVLALDAKWKTHGDYLASLASKYRGNVKNRVLAPIADAGLSLRRFEPDAELGARMHALYLQVHERAALRPFTLHAGYFSALARAAGPRLVCSGLFGGDDTLLGFICTLDDGVQALAYHIGFDRAAAKTGPLYLRLLHASIDDAIAMGARELSFGRTALEPKSRLGATAQPTAVWVRHRQPMMNRLLQPLLALAHPDEAPEVHPFKTT
jgi:Acetyltransferase (GNAT) domain